MRWPRSARQWCGLPNQYPKLDLTFAGADAQKTGRGSAGSSAFAWYEHMTRITAESHWTLCKL